jgi:MGT family glycosyltransferase
VETQGVRFRPYDPLGVRLPLARLVDFDVAMAEATERGVPQLVEELFAAEVDVVVHDCQAPWGRIAADFLGLPRVVSRPLFPRLREVFKWMRDRPGPDALARIEASRLAVARSWGAELGSWGNGYLSAGEMTVSYTTARFAGVDGPEAGWCYAGPLMDAEPARGTAAARPLVYVALGTMYNRRAEPFRAVIDALADEPVDVLVAVADSPVRDELGLLPANVSLRGHVDSRAVLARATVHVTHGGASSVSESLLAGVPMVCIPQGSDHFEWASRVEDLGAGAVVPEEPDAVRAAVVRLLRDDGPRARAEELREHFLAYDGEQRVSRMLETVLTREAGA